MRKATISIIIPVYKVELYLQRCMDSVLCQSFQSYNIILVDDGSPDRCPEICDAYAEAHENIHVIHQENRGLGAARNVGIDWAVKSGCCDYITFIDSDDWIHPQYLEYLYKAIRQTNTLISSVRYHGKLPEYVTYDSEPENAEIHVVEPEELIFAADRHFCSYAWGRLFHISLFRDIRFPEGKIWEDTPAITELFFAVDRIAVVEAKLYYYFFNKEGIAFSLWTPKRFDEIEAHFVVMPFYTQYKNGKCLNDLLYEIAHVQAKQIGEIVRAKERIADSEKYLGILRHDLRETVQKIRDRGMDTTGYEVPFETIMEIAGLQAQ